MKRGFRKRIFFKIFFLVIVFLAAFSAIVMLLWNNVLANVIHVSTINFWQALGILVLAKILFGGFRGGPGGGPWGQRWRNKWQQKWANMTPEERERLKQEWKNRCGGRFTDIDHFKEQSEPDK